MMIMDKDRSETEAFIIMYDELFLSSLLARRQEEDSGSGLLKRGKDFGLVSLNVCFPSWNITLTDDEKW